MTLSKMRFAGLVLLTVTGSILAACESSSSSSSGSGAMDAGAGFDGAYADAAVPEDSAAPGDAAVESFEGVWEGSQIGATVEVSNAAGCTVIKSTVNAVVCDECVGTYGPADAGVAPVVVTCVPIGRCSVSPAHTNTGTFTRIDGGALTYFYDYGAGTTSLDVQPTPRAPGDVCTTVDAGVQLP